MRLPGRDCTIQPPTVTSCAPGLVCTLAARFGATPPRMLAAIVIGATVYLSVAAATFGVRIEQVVACAGALALCVWGPGPRRLITSLMPFVLLGVIYDVPRLAAPLVQHMTVHVAEPYLTDLALFGVTVDGRTVPPHELFLMHTWPAVDLVAGLAYLLYFYVAVAYTVYLARCKGPWGRALAVRLGWTLFAVNLAGFATYFLYPAAPPWYTTAHGFGPPTFPVVASAAAAARWDALTGIPYFSQFYDRSAHVFGAIPSLHVAVPMLTFLYVLPLRNRLASAVALGFVLLVAFSAVYLQHHYVIDVLAGAAYAAAGVLIERRITARRQANWPRGTA